MLKLEHVLDLLFPRPECMVCASAKDVYAGICLACREKLTPLPVPDVSRLALIGELYAPFDYNDTARSLIHHMKYLGESDLTCRFFVPYIVQSLKSANISFDVVVSVPIAKNRLARRGYSQAWLLAKRVAKGLNVTAQQHALKSIGRHISQTGLSRQARIENMRGHITPGKGRVKGLTVLLIDDVVTTGATGAVCREVLYRMGAKRVVMAAACAVSAIKKQEIC